MLNVTLYGRKGCHLCDEAKALLNELQPQFPHRLAEVDIDSDVALAEKYGLEIPVVEVGPYAAKAPLDKQKLRMILGAAADRKNQLEQIGGEAYRNRVLKGQQVTGGDRVSFWIARHYLLLLNLFMLFYVGLPFLAPVLMKAGAELPARAIYALYKPLCHQFAFRSFFLFGEQPYYPLSEANIPGVKTFEEVSRIANLEEPTSLSRFAAREFIGDETLGYKVALCERDVAIYLAMLAFGLFFAATKRRLKPLHWMLWLALGLVPVGLDGFSQLFSQFNFDWLAPILPYRESTPFLRALTGALFGWMTAWFAYPTIEESMSDTRQYYIKKSAVQKASQ